MPRVDRSTIPGYLEGVEADRRARDEACLDVPVELCGVLVNPLTPRTLLNLEAVENPIVSGGGVAPWQVAQFLWALSPVTPKRSRWKRFWFARSIRDLDYGKAVHDCREFVNDAFSDAPARAVGTPSLAGASWFCDVVACLATHYGWTEREVEAIPFGRIWQYVHLIQRKSDPTAPVFSRRADRAVSLYLKEQNRKLAAQPNG